MTGVVPLLRFLLRRDRVYLPVWVVALVGLVYASAAAVERTYDSPVEIASYARNVGGSAAGVALGGPPVGLDRIGGILVFETSMTALIGVALMCVFTVVRHTRREEEAGRVELLGSTVISPHAVVTASVTVSLLAALLVGAGVAAALVAVGQPAGASVLYGASITAFGAVFTAVAACAAQVMSHARGAVGSSLAVLFAFFAVRAVGDVADNGLSWLSPMGWSQQVAAFESNRWWPLGLSVALAVVLLGAAVLLERRRDLGSGLLAARPGPASAASALGTPAGLLWRLQRGAVLSWAVGLLALGATFGSFTQEIQNMVDDNPALAAFFERSGGSLVDTFLATALLLTGIAACGFAVSSALRTRHEETADRLEQLLATGTSRTAWLGASALVTTAGTVCVLAAGGLGLGASYAATAGEPADVLRMAGYALAYLPAVLLVAAVALVLVGWAPSASAAAWALVVLAFVVGYFGSLLELPARVVDLSPLSHVPAVPSEAMTTGPLLVLGVVTVLLAAAGTVGFRRRDLDTG